MLVVWMNHDVNRKKKFSVLKSRAVEWGGIIRKGNSSRKEA